MYRAVSVTFLIKKSKAKEDHSCPIYLRISVNGKRSEIFTHRYCKPESWCSRKLRKKGTTEDTRKLNNFLDKMYSRIVEIHQELFDRKEKICSLAIKNKFLGKNEVDKSLLEVFTLHNENMKKLIGTDYVKSTYIKYNTTYKRLKDFIKSTYRKQDVFLEDLNYKFMSDFDYYLKTELNIGTNTSNKYLLHIKKVVNLAVDYEWINRNPFNNYKLKNTDVIHTPLSPIEINQIKCLENLPYHLEVTRDVFIFCCYTGLAYSDVKGLTNHHLDTKINGSSMITKKRQKTNVLSRIPLLFEAKEIIRKYKDDPLSNEQSTLLPVRSNQSYNRALKKVARLANIEKNLTSHMARHTFASELGNNSVPMTSISCALGHKNNTMTGYYTQISDVKIIQDFTNLKLYAVNHLMRDSA